MIYVFIYASVKITYIRYPLKESHGCLQIVLFPARKHLQYSVFNIYLETLSNKLSTFSNSRQLLNITVLDYSLFPCIG